MESQFPVEVAVAVHVPPRLAAVTVADPTPVEEPSVGGLGFNGAMLSVGVGTNACCVIVNVCDDTPFAETVIVPVRWPPEFARTE
jgi:hypothetical protein